MRVVSTTLWLVVAWMGARALGQPGSDSDPNRAREATRLLDEVGRDVQNLGDWSEQATLFEGMMGRLWEDNKWEAEPDQFAYEVAKRVTRIPPWRFNERMKTLTEMVGDRYQLDAGQRARFQSRMMREIFGFMVDNAEMISSQAREFIAARKEGRPFTPEMIARWTRESDPLIADGMMRADNLFEMMKRDMNKEQKKRLQRDYERFEARTDDLLKLRAAWAKGKWDPREWGLEQDPIHARAAARVRAKRDEPFGPGVASLVIPNGLGPHVPGHARRDALSYIESTWARYVRIFIEREGLDAGQREAALSILAELELRASQYRRTHASAIRGVPAAERATAKELAPIRAMFAELQARTEALLTQAQRERRNERVRN